MKSDAEIERWATEHAERIFECDRRYPVPFMRTLARIFIQGVVIGWEAALAAVEGSES